MIIWLRKEEKKWSLAAVTNKTLLNEFTKLY